MTDATRAFLALWNDVDPALADEYEAWHTFEHVPERVALPGFVAGWRYRAAERSSQRYFTRYALDALAALSTPAYADVVAHPTAWSARMRGALRNFLRQPCEIVLRVGHGVGGTVGTLVAETAAADFDVGHLASEAARLVDAGGVTSLDVGRAVAASPFPLPNAQPAATEGNARYVVIADALDRTSAEACLDRVAGLFEQQRATLLLRGAYDLVFGVARSALRDADAGRRPPRDDLRVRYGA